MQDCSSVQGESRHSLSDQQGQAVGIGLKPLEFVCGPAGTGKTFLAKEYAAENYGIVLSSTTGVAAVNLGAGTTINSLLSYFDTASLFESYTAGFLTARLGKLWKSGVRRILIDEVSMMDGDQLTILVKAIDELNGRGYVLDKVDDDPDAPSPEMGLTLIGDFAQLPPVKAPFAFESEVWPRFKDGTVKLTEIRRQADKSFIEALQAVRRGDGAYARDFFSKHLRDTTDQHFNGPTILAKNDAVGRFNAIRMAQLSTPLFSFPSSRWGKMRGEWGNHEKDPQTWGIPQETGLKSGCIVMVLANKREDGLGHPSTRPFLYVNGDLGTYLGPADGKLPEAGAMVKLQRTGKETLVQYVEREYLVPCDSARRKELKGQGKLEVLRGEGKYEAVGGISYLPLRVAYATTVHKSQGLSLDACQISIREPFYKTPSMLYVALSRARTLEGLRLVGSAAALAERATVHPKVLPYL